MENEADIKKTFIENLKAFGYHELHKIFQEIEIYFEITSAFIYDVKSQRFKSKKLLEIGSGATVHHIACASAYFPIIVQSDFVKDNREALKR
ncbi:uncharacterized protein TNIN_308681 [Trichonephila inaurata madagascariensis]|uniref:Uncharacterized protein n=1 Tax=Trichonephila inaurata madagascariensis TaxID=2747483 RepID=A0A8X6XGZ3_9ARAC|nr:uncharacterized protein TNIN_308681 [Trichonephila inaurata madagascariensis]